jgi:hypothetical protein
MTTYYDRTVTRHVDGTQIFATTQDRQSEAVVADLLGRAWQCDLHRFGELCALDWYATRYNRLVGVLELKTRTHASDRYPTVFLNVRKWLALHLASVGLGVPGVFVVRFTDTIRWCHAGLGMGPVTIGGCRTIVKARSDIEPIIEVSIDHMNRMHT